MTSSAQFTRRVLFVDGDTSFLNLVEKVFRAWHKGAWQILRCSEAGQALVMVEEELVDLVVVNPELPNLDGLQFIHLLQRRFANVPKAVLTSRPNDPDREAALRAGADVYLEKPSSIEALETVFAALNELTKWRPTNGFTGMMWCANLHEVLQIECLNQSSAVMEVISGANRGQVFIRDGVILHAHADHHKGTMALAYLLTFKGGQFYVKPYVDPPEITINGPWEALLMEAAQTRDEEGTAFFRRPVKKEGEIENWEKTGVPAPAPAALQSAAATLAEELLTPKVEELMIGAAKGDILFQWQCAAPEARVAFMNDLQEKARLIAPSLGAFDRAELRNGDCKIIVRIKNDSRLFARVHRPMDVAI